MSEFAELDELLADIRITDIHVKPFGVFVRKNGRLEKTRVPSGDLAERIKNRHGSDFSLSIGPLRLRGHVFDSITGSSLALRILPRGVPTFETLKLPGVLERIANFPHGLVSVCGTTGTGKTATIAAILDRINRTRCTHIVTIEDPVEILHEPGLSAISHRQVEGGGHGYAKALREAKREDPDVVMIGETRDAEALVAALDLAESGILVITTLHAADIGRALRRMTSLLKDEPAAASRIADTTRSIIAQKLVPGRSGERVLAQEYAFFDLALANYVRDDKIHQISGYIQTREQERKTEFRTFTGAFRSLLQEGLISRDIVEIYAPNPKDVFER